MPYGSGLSSQFGFAAESTWGTPVTVTKFVEHLEEGINWEPTWLDGAGIKAGQAVKRISRTKQSRKTVAGPASFECADKTMGLLWKHALGSTSGPTQIGATTAYKQMHTPGDKTGLGLTVQVGRPQTDGTVRPFTYEGMKIRAWEFSVSDGELARVTFEFDGQDQATGTALASASYTASTGVFDFSEASTFTLGGTASTAASEITVSGGTAVATVVRGITIRGETPMATERYGLGNSGVKSQPIENGFTMITGSLQGEFTSRTEIYDLMTGNTTTAMVLALTHGDAGGSNPFTLRFTIPALKMKQANVNVGGPDIIPQSINFEGYDDGTNAPIEVKIIETATTL